MDKLKISTWGTLPHIRKHQQVKRKLSKTTSRSKSSSSAPETVTMKLKNGAAVDPDSGEYFTYTIFICQKRRTLYRTR